MKLSFFLVLVLILSSCSHKSDTELYTDAKAAESKKDFQKAVELYEQVVDRFPTVATAESSLVRLSVIFNNDIKDPRKAIDAYRRCYTMFPSSKQAPTMLFLSGFVFNNELHMLDSARIVYETFLQKYPDNDLAASAKFELETLGKDPGLAINQQDVVTDNSKSDKPKKAVKK
jgi:TolA-binding protein